MKYTFSDKRDITDAFPISSRRATNTDWKLLDIHDDDGSEILSARSRTIFPQDEVSGRHIEEQENEREQEESQEDKTLDQSGVPEREKQGQQEQEQEPEHKEHEESQEDKTLDQDEVPEREQQQEKVSKQRGQSQEDKSLDQDEDNQDEQSKLRIVLELAKPTPVDIAPKSKARKLKGHLVEKLKDSLGDPRNGDVVIL